MKKLLILLTLVFCASALAQYNPLKPPPFRLLIEDTNWVRKFTKMSNYARTSSGTGEYWRNGDTLFFNFNGFVQKILLRDTPDSGDVWKYNGVVWRALPDEGVAGGPSDTALFAWKADTSSMSLMSLEALHSILSDTSLFSWKADSSTIASIALNALHALLSDSSLKISPIDSLSILLYSIALNRLDSNFVNLWVWADGYIPMMFGTRQVKSSGVKADSLATLNDIGNASNLTFGTAPASVLPLASTSSAGIIPQGVPNSTLKTDEMGLPNWYPSSGGGSGYDLSGVATFTTTAETTLVYIPGAQLGDKWDYVIIQPTRVFAWNANDMMFLYSWQDTVKLTRNAGGTSALQVFVVRISSGFDATLVPGCINWLAARFESMSDDDSVSTPTDHSPKQFPVTATGKYKPVYKLETDAYPYFYFSGRATEGGDSSFFACESLKYYFDDREEFTVFMVLELDQLYQTINGSNSRIAFWGAGSYNSSGDYIRASWYHTTTQSWRLDYGDGLSSFFPTCYYNYTGDSITTHDPTNRHLYTWQRRVQAGVAPENGAVDSMVLWIDGDSVTCYPYVATDTTLSDIDLTIDNFYIGAYLYNGALQRPMQGKIKEWIIYNNRVATTNREWIENQLMILHPPE